MWSFPGSLSSLCGTIFLPKCFATLLDLDPVLYSKMLIAQHSTQASQGRSFLRWLRPCKSVSTSIVTARIGHLCAAICLASVTKCSSRSGSAISNRSLRIGPTLLRRACLGSRSRIDSKLDSKAKPRVLFCAIQNVWIGFAEFNTANTWSRQQRHWAFSFHRCIRSAILAGIWGRERKIWAPKKVPSDGLQP